MEDQSSTEDQPKVGDDAVLGVGALLIVSFGKGVREAVIEAQYEDRYLLSGKFGRVIMSMRELKSRRYIVLPPRPAPARLSWWTKSVYAQRPEP
jgi:hypothetical protein